MSRTINDAGMALIKGFEGIMDGDPKTVNIDPYLCPAGVATIGWGHAIAWHGQQLKGPIGLDRAKQIYPQGLTLQQCEDLLRTDLIHFSAAVESMVSREINDNQFAALVSFAFNLGEGNLQSSTLLHLVNAGEFQKAADEFGKWIHSNGRVLDGLKRRREAEKELFLS